MTRSGYERLSGLDTSFLVLESRDVYAHVASTLIFEAGPLRLADGGIDFESIAKAHRALLHRIPRYRQVLRFIPVTGQPVWVDDARFDLSYHLRHTSLPRPGNAEQLKRLAARVMQQHLDRARPLWETWVVEGLEGDRFALISKVHHCMIDGLAGIDLLQILLSRDSKTSLPSTPPEYEPRAEPRPWELVLDDLAHRARLPFDTARGLRGLLREADDASRELRLRARGALATFGTTVRGPSETPLNQPIGPHRRFEWHTTDLDALRDIKRALGGTVNDIVVAIASGAFRHFLSDRGVDTSQLDFRALVPVSVRTRDEATTLGNRVSGWILSLPIDEPAPKERLRRIAEETAQLKRSKRALGAEILINVADWAPATLLTLGARAAARVLPFNTIVTNVPGPQEPMYHTGARLLEAYPHVPLVDRVDLAIALMSYAGRLHWGINADYDAVPDVDAFAQALQRSFYELQEAAGPHFAPAGAIPDDEDQPSAEVDPAVQARRDELTDLARERHDALTAAIDRLESALAAPAMRRAKRWSERVATELELVREEIRAHVESVETSRGLFEAILAEKPRLVSRVDALRTEHRSMLARASALAAKLPGDERADFGSLRREAAELLATLRGHRADEADLIYDVFWTDLGAPD